VYEAIRDRILSGELAPSTFVREEEVGKAMGVSRTPVREALNRLSSEGLLERIPHRGFRVPKMSIEELIHLYPVLRALDLLAGELVFPRLTAADLERLEQINNEFGRALQSNDVPAAIELNDQFHHVLSELCGNPVLCGLLDDLRTKVRRLEVLDFTRLLLERERNDGTPLARDHWARQHAAILDAVRQGEYDRASELLRENRSLVFQAEIEQVRLLVSRHLAAAG
jgi:DNA-binding GntR family transcriptional regulator